MTGGDDPTMRYLAQMQWFDDQHAEYKVQLAEALVAFNRIENLISDMCYTVLTQAGRGDLVAKVVGKQFMGRVEALELLTIGLEGAPPVPFGRLQRLAGRRNDFAHGHFSSDPDTGVLVIRGKGKAEAYDRDAIISFLEECATVRTELQKILGTVIFGDLNAPADSDEVPGQE